MKRKQRGLVIKACERCAAEYRGRKQAKFCSVRCGAIARTDRKPNTTSFKRGHPSWNAGMSVSGMSGKAHSEDSRAKIRSAQTGPLASNWKGGITAENYRIRRGARYAAWRDAVFQRDSYTCQECGDRSTAGNRIRLNADHIKPFAFFPDLRFDLSNGRTLCEPCHRKTPTWGAHRIAEERHVPA